MKDQCGIAATHGLDISLESCRRNGPASELAAEREQAQANVVKKMSDAQQDKVK